MSIKCSNKVSFTVKVVTNGYFFNVSFSAMALSSSPRTFAILSYDFRTCSFFAFIAERSQDSIIALTDRESLSPQLIIIRSIRMDVSSLFIYELISLNVYKFKGLKLLRIDLGFI